MSEPTFSDTIRTHYETYVDNEDARLRGGTGRLELARVQEIVRRNLPQRLLRVLDVGGATGVHAEWLLADGHTVHLVDPVAVQVERAPARLGGTAGFSSGVGDVRALPVADASFDVVLMFGPLYHLPEPEDRATAWHDGARRLPPGRRPVLGLRQVVQRPEHQDDVEGRVSDRKGPDVAHPGGEATGPAEPRGRALHLDRHRVHQVHRVPVRQQPLRVHAGRAPDVQDAERALGEVPAHDLLHPGQLEPTHAGTQAGVLVVDVGLVVGADRVAERWLGHVGTVGGRPSACLPHSLRHLPVATARRG